MAYNLADDYPTKSAAWCLDQLDKLADQEAPGKIITGAASGEVSAQYSIQQNLQQRKDSLRRSLYAKDPVTYANYAEVGQNVTGVAFFSVS